MIARRKEDRVDSPEKFSAAVIPFSMSGGGGDGGTQRILQRIVAQGGYSFSFKKSLTERPPTWG
jgi:hypothetical protein